MEYREVITAYQNNSLDISDFKSKLEEAKPLKGRQKYRALSMLQVRFFSSLDMHNILSTPETESKFDSFARNCSSQLNYYYSLLLDSIKSTKAWKYVGLNSKAPNEEIYKKLPINKKFELFLNLNRKYSEFLDIQQIADIRSALGKDDLDDETIRKIQFIRIMYDGIESDLAKSELYNLSAHPKLVSALVEYRSSKKKKNVKLEDFIKSKGKKVSKSYEEIEKLFEIDEIKDISEVLSLIQETLNMPLSDIMPILSEISEGEAEKYYLSSEYADFQKLQEKYQRMAEIKRLAIQEEEEKKHKEAEEKRRIELENEKRRREAEKKRIEEREKYKRDRTVEILDGDYTKELEGRIDEISKTPLAKEIVIPVVFMWLEREDRDYSQISKFFERIRTAEIKSKARASLYLITNASKEVTLQRFNKLRQLAKEKGMPRMVEGALGGYGSFRIDENGNIADLAIMSDENKKRIKLILQEFGYDAEIEDTEYLRYQITDKKDKHITPQYIAFLRNSLKGRTELKNQPIELISYTEGDASGIDVLLETQLDAVRQIPSYYQTKYYIKKGTSITVQKKNLKEYLENSLKKQNEQQLE